VRALPHGPGGARDEAHARGGKPPGPLCHDHGAFPHQVENGREERKSNMSNPFIDLAIAVSRIKRHSFQGGSDQRC